MKKTFIYSVVIVLLLTVIIAGSSYAFFFASAQSQTNASGSSKKFDVVYSGGNNITGPIEIGSSKEDGTNTEVNIRIGPGSIVTRANLYINVEKITSNLAIEGFVWEVVGIKNSNQVYYKKGNFENINDTDNNIVNIVEDYELSEENTTFIIYLWIDGSKIDNNVLDSEFKGYIEAKTGRITGVVN